MDSSKLEEYMMSELLINIMAIPKAILVENLKTWKFSKLVVKFGYMRKGVKASGSISSVWSIKNWNIKNKITPAF